MSEYWKSNAKKYCEVCKCWFADNKVSIEHHERGLRHKSMVQKRLREVTQNEIQRERQYDKLSSTLIQMEQAALKSMGKSGNTSDISKMKIDGATIGPSIGAAVYADNGTVIPKIEKLSEYERQKQKVQAEREKLRQLKRTAKESTIWKGDEEFSTTNTQETDVIQWVKAIDQEKEYYFNMYTGETTWNNPGKFITLEEYYSMYTPSTSADSSVNYHQNTSQSFNYSEPPPPPDFGNMDENTEKDSQIEPIPLKKIKSENDFKVETEEYDVEDQTDISKPEIISNTEPIENEVEIQIKEKPKTSSGGLLGPWVPVVKKEKPSIEEKVQILLDDLPEEAKQVKTLEPTFDEIEAAELTFEEKKAPITTKKSTKTIEFKKRKTNKNIRVREEH